MGLERTKLFKKAEVLIETNGGAVTFEFYTGKVSADLTLRKSVSINTGGDLQAIPVIFPGDTRGRIYQARIVPGVGVSAILEGLRIYRKTMDPVRRTTFEWVSIPVEATGLGFQEIRLPVEKTPLSFRPLSLPVPPTPSQAQWVDLPLDE